MLKKNIDNYFLVLFSLLPISIIAGSSISLINILLIDFSFLLLIISNKNFSFLKSSSVRYLLILYLYLIFNSLIALDKEISLLRNLGFIRMIILFLAFNFFFNEKIFLKKVLSVWSIILLIVLFDIFFESFTGQNIFGFGGDDYGRRIVSFFKDEPIVGGYVSGLYLIVLGFLYNEINFKHKNLIFIISILFMLAIILTGERSNTIRAILGLFIFYLVFKEYGVMKKITFFASSIILLLVLIINSEFLKMRYVHQIQAYFTSNQIYFSLYKSGFEVFKNNKIFGVGNKNYRIESCSVKETDIAKKDVYMCTTHPHQIYFEILSEHGIVGFILIFYIFYKLIFSKIYQTFRDLDYLSIGSLIYLMLVFLPLIPSGAFFNDYMLTLFMINLSILYSSSNKLNIFYKQK